jgi:hypothetical protein
MRRTPPGPSSGSRDQHGVGARLQGSLFSKRETLVGKGTLPWEWGLPCLKCVNVDLPLSQSPRSPIDLPLATMTTYGTCTAPPGSIGASGRCPPRNRAPLRVLPPLGPLARPPGSWNP